MGHISVKWSWSSKKRRIGATIIGLAKIHTNGFQIDGSLRQMKWVMENVKGAFFKLEEFDPVDRNNAGPSYDHAHPEALLFIAPDELALARLVRNM